LSHFSEKPRIYAFGQCQIRYPKREANACCSKCQQKSGKKIVRTLGTIVNEARSVCSLSPNLFSLDISTITLTIMLRDRSSIRKRASVGATEAHEMARHKQRRDKQVEPVLRTDGKNPAAVALGRLGGLKGGPARARKLTKEQRSEIAKKAAEARWRA
jgi:hypothetical protein